MGTIVDYTGDLLCAYCELADAELYNCDECGLVFCQDCGPEREDDAPADLCLKCIAWDVKLGKNAERKPQIGELGAARKRIADLEAIIYSNSIRLIAAERRRQVEKEGWTAQHDDTHLAGELALAAACYALPYAPGVPPVLRKEGMVRYLWPWPMYQFHPTEHDRVRELVKAGALIAAEIDRLQRTFVEGEGLG